MYVCLKPRAVYQNHFFDLSQLLKINILQIPGIFMWVQNISSFLLKFGKLIWIIIDGHFTLN